MELFNQHNYMLLEDECSICLDTNNEEINYTCIQCNKPFHKTCLSEWLEYTPNCPTCRYSLIEIEFDPSIIEIFIVYNQLSQINSFALHPINHNFILVFAFIHLCIKIAVLLFSIFILFLIYSIIMW
jgi:DNA-directed RNA polymerase subunit RPC12/RpoP